ncbi:MAG: ABC transporter ATP-binding protein [Desulfurococcaceae archaeon]
MLLEVLIVNDLWVKYYTMSGVVEAVSGVSFRLREKEMLAIVGESGSGKSTLGFSILNMVPKPGKIVNGQILLEGTDILKLHPHEIRKIRGSKISMIFQDPFTTLDPLRKIVDQFGEFLVEHGVEKSKVNTIVREYLEAVGLPERIMYSYPHQLSGGQKQRVSIAMAIALNPRVVVADEPTTALDVVVQKQIMDLIDAIKEKYGTSIILITHDLALALERANSVMVMYGGYIMEYADKTELYNNMKHPYTKALFEALPRVMCKTLPKSLPGNPPDLRRPPPGCIFHPRCEFATEKCRIEKPRLREVSKNHLVACHYAGEIL